MKKINTIDEDATMEELNLNTDGDVDMNDSEEMPAIDKRSERFGTELRENTLSPVDDLQLTNLYKSLGVDKEEYSIDSKWGKHRFNAIHIRGVNDMSTDDILDYFKGFGSPSVEWINDISCNVVWVEPYFATKAMLALSRPIVKDEQNKNSSVLPENMDDTLSIKNTEIVMFTDEDNGEADEIAISNTLPVDEIKDQVEKSDDGSIVAISEISIPVPPGLWRYGNAHTKSKAIVMRFATKSDRKLPGAEKRSEYYLKYGNPNYGGMKGIISTSRKRKYRETTKQKEPFVEKKSDADDDEEFTKRFNLFNSQESTQEVKKTKKLRMKMYADEEVGRKQPKKPDNDTSFSHNRDLRSRLEAHKERHHNDSHASAQLSPDRRQNRTNVDLRTKLNNRPPPVRHESSRESGDDLRGKLDQIRQKKKFLHRSPLVIHILEEAKTS